MFAVENKVPAMQIDLHTCSDAKEDNMVMSIDGAVQATRLYLTVVQKHLRKRTFPFSPCCRAFCSPCQ